MSTVHLPETVVLDDARDCIIIPDQTKFPQAIEMLELRTPAQVRDAIYRLSVRGAPAIGIAAAAGLYLAAKASRQTAFEPFYAEFQAARALLESARPTAVNLAWALSRMDACARDHAAQPVPRIKRALLECVQRMREDDIRTCKRIGEYGLSLLQPRLGVLTHCNAGQFATIRYGTATAPIYLAHERGYALRVYADETRPLLQGARITCMELMAAGIDVTLLCDNMAASLMDTGAIDAVFVGCDRVAANGDAANKIGTFNLAIVAKHFGVPIYFCAPTSTIDWDAQTGERIPVEQRPAQEVTDAWYAHPMAPEGIGVYNPSFDVTDARLIAGIITEYGIAYPPYTRSLSNIRRQMLEDSHTQY